MHKPEADVPTEQEKLSSQYHREYYHRLRMKLKEDLRKEEYE